MSDTHKQEYHQKTDKYKSNRFSGHDHFRIKPFGLKGFDWFFKIMRDKLGNICDRPREDVLSTVNNTSRRMKDKIELKKEIENLDNE